MSFSVLTKSLIDHPLQGNTPIKRPLASKYKTMIPITDKGTLPAKKSLIRKQKTMMPLEVSFQYEPPDQSSLEIPESSTISEPQLKPHENIIKTYPDPLILYNPNKVPPDFVEANNHRLAHKINPYEAPKPDDEICQSTGLPLPQETLRFDCHRLELSHLGPVLPMYLLLVNQIGLIAALLSTAAFILNFCQYNSIFFEYQDFVVSLFQETNMLVIMVLLMVTLVLGLFWILHLFRRKQKLTKLSCKKTRITPSSYTVMCSNMGKVYKHEEVTKFFSDQIISDYSLDVVQVVITYNIEKYTQEIRKLERLIQEKEQALKSKDDKALESINQKIQAVNMFFEENKRKLKGFEGLKRNGVSFITFDTKQEAKTVRRKFEMSAAGRFFLGVLQTLTDAFDGYSFKHNLIKVEKAPELNEIIWDNLNCNKTKRSHGLKSISMIILLSSFSYINIYLLAAYNIPYSALLSGLIIVLVNEALAHLIFWLGLQERFKTITEFNIALIQRMTLMQVMNTILPILVINIFILNIPLAQFSESLGTVSSLIFFIPLIVSFINPSYLLKAYRRKQLIDQGHNCQLSQAEVNHIFEDPEINMPRLYADCLRIILFSCFYFPISPGLGFIGCIAVILHFWVERFNILRRNLLPTNMRSEIAEAAFEFLDCSPLFLALGSLIMLSVCLINGNLSGVLAAFLLTLTIIVTLLSTIYLMLPNKRLNRTWFSRKSRPSMTWVDELFYQQASEHMPKDYLSINPVFRDKKVPAGLQDFYVKAQEKFKDINITKELPEVLPLFDYTMHRPTLYEIWRDKMTGLSNPYFSFPQNYGYGLPSLSLRAYEPQKSVSYAAAAFGPQKTLSITVKSDNLVQRRFSLEDKENKQPGNTTSILKSQDRKPKNMQSSPPETSLIRDWSMLLKQNTKNEEECEVFEFSPKGIDMKIPENSQNNLDQPDFLADLTSIPLLNQMSSIKQGRGVLKEMSSENNLPKPLFFQKQNAL